MKKLYLSALKARKLFLLLLLLLCMHSATVKLYAQNYTVNSTIDGSAVNQLRGALVTAGSIAGTHIITVNAGIYNLTSGQISFGSVNNVTIIIEGAGEGTTIIDAGNLSRAFIFNTTGAITDLNITVKNLTIRNCREAGDAFGGGAILCGGSGANNVSSFNNCTFQNNTINTNVGATPGGAIRCSAASLYINACTFTGNINPLSDGGAVRFDLQFGESGTLSITNSLFSGNSAPANSAAGGALSIGIAGGATATCNVTENNFLTNSAVNGLGGAIGISHGLAGNTININYNRFVGNTVLAANSSRSAVNVAGASGNVNLANNWWGCNGGASGCADKAAVTGSPGGTNTFTPHLQLKTTASPVTICSNLSGGNTTTITASFLSNSDGGVITAGNLDALIGKSITFTPVLGSISAAQPTIQTDGRATAIFTSNGTGGVATVNAVVDNVPTTETAEARASITVNSPPAIAGGGQPVAASACAGAATTTLSVTATGTAPLTYQWRKGTTNLSNGATGNGSTISGATTATLTISNITLADAANDYNVVVTNSCGTATSNNTAVTVTALPVVTAPTVTQPTCTTPTGTIVVNATGSGTLEYSINNGSSYQPTATFSGLAPGSTHNIRVRGVGSTCFNNYSSNPVVLNSIPASPSVNNPGTTTGTVAVAFSQSFTATGGLAPIGFSTTSTLPTGLTLSAAGVLSGTPTQSGTFPIVVKATDANGCFGNGATYNLVISCQTITVTNPGTTTGTVGTAFSQTFTQTGGNGAITFSTSSTLPTGITLSAAGVLSGTPTQSGTFPIVVRATDVNACFGNGATYNLVINCQTITVTNPVNATGQLNIPFSQTFTQTGGNGAITFSTTSTLPTGLTLSAAGVLSGTPTQTGTFPIVVRATDVNTCFGIGTSYSLVIIACPISNQTVTAAPLSVCSGTGSTVTVGASEAGINYTLRNNTGNAVIAGPTASNGPAINFSTGNITTATTYNVLAETDKYSVYLDGSQSGFAIPQASALNLTDNFTVEGWIKPDGVSSFGRLFNKDGSYALGISSNQSRLTFTRHGSGDYSSPFTFVSGQWYHIACTYVSGTVELFVNGNSIGSVSSVPSIVTTSNGGHIGSDNSGNSNRFKGNIDNVRLWSSVRTQTEISANQSAYLTSTGNPTLNASWWIIEGTGNAKDYSANAVNATGLSGTWQISTPTAFCSVVMSATPTVAITPDNTITLSSAAGTNAQTLCINTPVTDITYNTTGATGATFSGLPAGVTGSWAANVVTISGMPTTTAGSPFNYTVTLTGGCGTITANGSITVTPVNTITRTSAPATTSQVVCVNGTITNIIYSTTGATGATFSGLPAGVTGGWAANVVTISGAPTTAAGSPFSYTVTLTGGCGVTTANGTITVNPVATVNTVNNQVVCNNAGTTAVTFSSPTTGGTIVYNWTNNTPSIGIAASGSGNISSFTAVNTSSAPVTATFTVTPAYTSGGVTCNGTPSSFTISVNPTATVTAVDDQVVCNSGASAAVTFSSPTTGGTIVYNWVNNAPGIGLAANGSGNIGSFNAINTTNAPVVATITATPTFTAGSVGCAGTPEIFTITVTPTPTVNTITNQVVCNDAQTTAIAFSGLPSGNEFTWTNNNTDIGLAASGTGNIDAFTATNTTNAPVTATITVTPSYDNAGGPTCTGTPATFTITVNPSAIVNTVDDQTACNGAQTTGVTFSSATSGGTIVYNWTNNTPSIGLAASGTGDIAAFTAVNATNEVVTGTVIVTPAYTNGGTTCNGVPDTFTISVNPIPTVNAVDDRAVCNGVNSGAINFGGTVTGTTYSWTNSNTAIGLSANGTGNINSFTATNATSAAITGTVTVTPSYTFGGTICTGTPVSFMITVKPSPDGTITGGGITACQDGATLLSAVSNPNYVYAWGRSLFTNPYTPIGTSQTQQLTASGNYQLIVTDTVTTCSKTTLTTVNIADYVFNGSIGAGDAQQTGRINRFAVTSTCASPQSCPGIFTSTGARYYDSYTITNPRDVPVCATVGINSACSTNIFCVAYSGSFDPTSPCTNYLADGGSSFFNSGFYEATIPANGTIVVVVHEVNPGAGCNNYSLTVDVPREAAGITAIPNTAVCSGTTVVLTASTANTYSWTPGNQVTQAINVTSTSTNTVLLGYGNVGCTATASKDVLVNPTPEVNAINNQVLCSNESSATVSFTGNVNGAVYNWTNNTPSIGLAASGSGDIASFTATNITNAPVTATVTVTPAFISGNDTCTGSPETFTITVNPLPVLVVHDTTVYGNVTVNLTAPGITAGSDPGLNFSYWTNASATTPVPNPSSVGDGTYYIVAENANGCKDTAAVVVTVVPFRSVSGKVYNDVDGLNGSPANTINGPGTNAGNLKVVLVTATLDSVVKVQPVLSNGTFVINEILQGSYQLLITTATVTGSTVPPVTLAAGWVHTGEFLGAGAGSDGNRNGILNLGLVNADFTNAKFGIEQPPVASNSSITPQVNPGSNASVSVNGNAFACSDPSPGAVRQIRFTTYPTNAASVFIGFNSYTASNWPAQGVTVTAIGNQPLLPISIDPLMGPRNVMISYMAIDAAGFTSNTVTISMPFFGINIGGIVHNDVNGLLGVPANTINGPGIPSIGLNAVLIDAIMDTVIAVVPVAPADGSYTFTGNDAGYYGLRITTNLPAVGAPSPAVAIPAGWAHTGEKNGSGAGTDGYADGKLDLGDQQANNTQTNFGIQQPPKATAATAASQLNPGGSNTAVVPPATFVTYDSLPGAVTSVYFSGALPANASKLVLNGTAYTATNPLPPAGIHVLTNTSTGQPVNPILVDPANGNVTVAISYKSVDASGMMSATTIASVPFTNQGLNSGSNGVAGVETPGKEGAANAVRYEVSVYPNPAAERVYVKTNYASDIKEIKLLDIQGRELYRQKESFNDGIDMQNRAAGTYLIKVIFNDGVMRDFKVVKN